MRVDEESRETLRSLAPRIQGLAGLLGSLASGSKAGMPREEGSEDVVRHMRVMQQWVHWITTDDAARSRYMGGNLIDVADKHGNKRFIVWAHNNHVALGGTPDGEPNL